MKRKTINILLSILILFSNSGWAITFHYCKDTLSSVSLEYITSASEEEEGCATMDSCCASDDDEDETETSHKKCCDDTSVTSSISDSTSVVKVLELQLHPFVIVTSTLPVLEEVSIAKMIKKSISTDFFTLLNAPPLYELYCQRVFYSGNR
ncbi:HYC_CC_PP family protein [Capnocytophaga sp. HP1101]